MSRPKRSRISAENLEAVFGETLERIRRGARLVGAAAEEARAGASNVLGGSEGLVAALDGARAGHDGNLVAADGGVGIGEADDRVFFLEIAADQLVGLADADDFLHARHLVEGAGIKLGLVAGDADGGALRAGHGVRAEAQTLDSFAYLAHVLFGSVRFHDNQHGRPLVVDLVYRWRTGGGNGTIVRASVIQA